MVSKEDYVNSKAVEITEVIRLKLVEKSGSAIWDSGEVEKIIGAFYDRTREDALLFASNQCYAVGFCARTSGNKDGSEAADACMELIQLEID